MYKCARFYIAVRIYMQIPAPAGYTSVYIFSVVPEIYRKYWFGPAEFSHAVIHEFAVVQGVTIRSVTACDPTGM